jgi:uncharacterized repeat protein (TIGR03803 family)
LLHGNFVTSGATFHERRFSSIEQQLATDKNWTNGITPGASAFLLREKTYSKGDIMRSKNPAIIVLTTTSIAPRFMSRSLVLTLIAMLWLAVVHPVSSATETILHSFFSGDASNPNAGVVFGKKNNLFGLTPLGGDFNEGAIYEVGPAGNEQVLYSFTDSKDGGDPQGTLAVDTAGNLYGSTCLDGAHKAGTVFKLSTSNTFSVVYAFKGGKDGSCPTGGMVFDKLGNLYGTSFSGGASNAGTIFKLTPSGTHTVVYSFKGGADGSEPNGSLAITPTDTLYGTTSSGGSFGFGTLFELSPSNVHTVKWSFSGGTDGSSPNGGLVLYKGVYFGTTIGGGTGGAGIVYGWAPTHPNGLGIYWAFTGGADGGNPDAGVVSDKKGNLYGTTSEGGSSFLGTVFQLQIAVAPITETVLHNFGLDPDGQFPRGGVVLDKSGNLYGTTSVGGSDSTCEDGFGCGVVFKVTP